MLNIACLVESEDHEISFTWSHGPATFEAYYLSDFARERLLQAARDARDAFAVVVESWLQSGQAGAAEARDFATAGYELRRAVFAPDRAGDIAREVDRWLTALRDADPDVNLEIVHDGSLSVPWNFVYDKEPSATAFAANDLTVWEPFWALRYTVCSGQRVDPRRRLPIRDPPRLVLVADRPVWDSLTADHRTGLTDFAHRHGAAWLFSRLELEQALTAGRPDLLFVLCHANDNALQLENDVIPPLELYRLLQRVGGDVPHGLVFLNSCHTAVARPGQRSFSEAVFALNMSGLIGTEQLVIDTFAGPFGRQFLEAFCDAREPVGPIMRRLRGNVPPDGKTLLAHGELAALWDMATGERHVLLMGRDQTNVVGSTGFSANGRTLATSDKGGALWFWDVGSGQTRLLLPDLVGEYSDIVFSPDGTGLAFTDRAGRLRILNSATGQELVDYYRRQLVWNGLIVPGLGASQEVREALVPSEGSETSAPEFKQFYRSIQRKFIFACWSLYRELRRERQHAGARSILEEAYRVLTDLTAADAHPAQYDDWAGAFQAALKELALADAAASGDRPPAPRRN